MRKKPATPMNEDVVLETQKVTKEFPGVVALDRVSLALHKNEILGVVGENGAGKSTLMKILGGVYKPTDGEIYLHGHKAALRSPKDSLNAGISIVYQELNLIPHLTVAENIFANRLPRKNGFVQWKKLYVDTEQILKANGMTGINPRDIVADLPIGLKQSVEIAKALSYNANVLLLDEPTSSLTEPEIENLFQIIRKLQEKGISIIYISHHLDEIFSICNRVHILRDGRTEDIMPIQEATEEKIVSKMVGRDIKSIYFKENHPIGDVTLEVKGVKDDLLKNVNLTLKKSEVLSIYGLLGSGRTELLKAIVGARKAHIEEIKFQGRPIRIKAPIDAIKQGIVYSSEDRKGENLFFGNSVWKNISYSAIQIGQFVQSGFIRRKDEQIKTGRYFEKLNVRAPTMEMDVYNLSGGNQQKVCLAKALINEPQVLLLDEPTRGIDVGAKLEIYRLMSDLAKQGKSIIFVSSELPEVIGCSDRVYSMANGRITQEFIGDAINEENILKYCLKKDAEEATAI
ncbi:MAG: sugar ABC transporter ATP-binding protein [Desulfobacterales bacterium]|jgi:ABC-type sugar transport system ATPase subunit